MVDAGVEEATARKRVKVPTPTKPTVYKRFMAERGDDRYGIEGVAPWWRGVSSRVYPSAFLDADAAWKNWLDSFKGKRAGCRVGHPRFKRGVRVPGDRGRACGGRLCRGFWADRTPWSPG
ncbi:MULTISPECIES: transposase [unclassified Streptomyces]|uniref:transposase n=1 Tax=unclassified Streptomyces TaxID=2593676 RepID=UPI001EF12B8C|nr:MULTISPECIES: transposase [unclassified Streptomyces]